MKRTATFVILMLSFTQAFAQGASDALMYSRVMYEGTARTTAMGNAFTALGGDMGAISINPASSGVYRYSQFSVTPSVVFNGSRADYLDNITDITKAKVVLPNTGIVFTFDTGAYRGLLNFNLGFTANRVADFNTVMSCYGTTGATSKFASIASDLYGVSSDKLEQTSSYDPYTETSLPWNSILAWNTYLLATLPDADDEYVASTENIDGHDIYVGGDLMQDYYRRTTGGIMEYSLNFGTNISDMLYLGVNLNLESVRYTVEESYVETASDSDDFQDGFVKAGCDYWQQTVGSGVNFKFGAIYNPLPGLRLGATVTTPTWFNLTDNWRNYMTSEFNNSNKYSGNSPAGVYEYRVTSPMRFSLAAAYTFGGSGLVSFDYERVNYGAVKMAEYDGSVISFKEENDYISKYCRASNIFRLGGEYWVIPNVALRAGYNFYGNPGDGYNDIHTASVGVGFKFGDQDRSTVDLAYQRVMEGQESYALYSDYGGLSAPVGVLKSNGNKILLTYSVKF